MNNHRSRFVFNSIFCFIVILSILSGCAAHTLRDAQNAYREGAEMEWGINNELISATPQGTYEEYGLNPAASYAYANDILDKLLKEKKDKLKKEGLLATTYLLKALCLVKINPTELKYKELEQLISKAKQENPSSEQLLVLDTIIPLYESEKQQIAIEKYMSSPNPTNEDLEPIVYALFTGPNSIDNSFKNLSNQDTIAPLKIYLMEARLNLFVLYYSAANYLKAKKKDSYKTPAFVRREKLIDCKLKSAWEDYTAQLAKSSYENEGTLRKDRLYAFLKLKSRIKSIPALECP
ncbi:hypothetical protein [Maridesulfovibrio sp.]|uniref:hypothetical protein n=1 Tax=Maridesulfovibrio sp. TaxID=2795000 RepID=UPI0029F50712|nr:hypothetical protein [Maridesulfovibrio sp.]